MNKGPVVKWPAAAAGCAYIVLTAVLIYESVGYGAERRADFMAATAELRGLSTRAAARRAHVTLPTDLTPLAAGPGLIVLEPVVASADQNAAAFGTGCLRWIMFNASAQPGLDQSPPRDEVMVIARKIGQPNMRCGIPDAARIAARFGNQSVLVATITGTRQHISLELRLVQVSKALAETQKWSLTGSEQEVTARLGETAAAIARKAGASEIRDIPQSTLGPTDFETLGDAPADMSAASGDQVARLRPLAKRDPAAAFFAVMGYYHRDEIAQHEVAQELLKVANRNPLAVAQMVDYYDWIAPYSGDIRQLGTAFPRSYLAQRPVAQMLAFYRRMPEAVQSASMLPRIAPLNARAWLVYATSLGSYYTSIRRGRLPDSISRAEWADLEKIQGPWLAACKRACDLAPDSGRAYAELAGAATEAGDDDTAKHAIDRLIVLSPSSPSVLVAALDLLGRKWLDDPARLKRAAEATDAAKDKLAQDGIDLSANAAAAGFPELAQSLRTRMRDVSATRLSRNPRDYDACLHHLVACRLLGSRAEAARDAIRLKQLGPNCSLTYTTLSSSAIDEGKWEDAVSNAVHAIELDPAVAWNIGSTLMLLKQANQPTQFRRLTIAAGAALGSLSTLQPFGIGLGQEIDSPLWGRPQGVSAAGRFTPPRPMTELRSGR